MRSCPSVGALDQGMVTPVATRRPGRWSDGSTRSRNGVAPVAPLSSRTTTTSLVTSAPAFERQPKYATYTRSEEHTSELQSHSDLVCRLLLEKKKKKQEANTDKKTQKECDV